MTYFVGQLRRTYFTDPPILTISYTLHVPFNTPDPTVIVRALKHGDLTEDERRRITAGWLMQCVRGSDGILRRYGIAVPPDAIPNERVAGFSVR